MTAPTLQAATKLDDMYSRLDHISDRLYTTSITVCESADRILGPCPVNADKDGAMVQEEGKISNINDVISRIEMHLSSVEHSVERLQEIG
jgi:hypothetical protein